MEFYAAERKKELIPFATAWVELESIMLSEISQVVRDKYIKSFKKLKNGRPKKEFLRQKKPQRIHLLPTITAKDAKRSALRKGRK